MASSPQLPQQHNLPPQLTAFIGRANEVVEINQMLADPACRLLTLIGPGGVGKTRLALQATNKALPQFADGVWFVPLQPIQSTDSLVFAIAEALHLALPGQELPAVQLLNYLSDKQMLLLLDNFEQLLPTSNDPSFEATDQAAPSNGVDLFIDLLQQAPGLKLMVTSREVLNLQGEWLYTVQGLPFPDAESGSEASLTAAETYEAVQLFIERARRVRRDFDPAAELEGVVRICRLVEGIPLAIELSATWTKSLSCTVIAAEIQANTDFLVSNFRNMPDRQRSIRAVFDRSWQRLDPAEKEIFKRLSVFRGGFRREAAKQVAQASLQNLSALVDKSLLRWEADGRYQVHEMLRQYAAEQLVKSPEDVARIYDLHCSYYADFMAERLKPMLGERHRETKAEIEAEMENIRAAWRWAIELIKPVELEKLLDPLDMFYQLQGRYLEGSKALAKAIEQLAQAESEPSINLILMRTSLNQGYYYIRLGRLAEAEAAITESLRFYRQLNLPPVPGYSTDPLLASGILATIRGDYAAAAHLADQSRQANEANHHFWNRQFAYYLLTRVALLQGDYPAAQQYARQTYALVQETNDRWFMAYCLNELGNVACALNEYDAARDHYQASYALREAFDDPEGMALALNHLGEVALHQQNPDQAGQHFEQSLAIYRKIKDKGGLATSLAGLGRVALIRGELEAARDHFQQALQITAESHFTTLTLSLFVGIGELLLQTGRPEHGLELLRLSLHHPASEQGTRGWARQVLYHYQSKLSPALFAVSQRPLEANELEGEITKTQAQLATPIPEGLPGTGQKILSALPPPDISPLVEPLTPRELEILQLIAEGLTNQAIAEKLSVVVGTVKTHNNNIYGKLGVTNRVQALARARELKLL